VTWWTFLVALEKPRSGSGSFLDDPAHFVLAKPQKSQGWAIVVRHPANNRSRSLRFWNVV